MIALTSLVKDVDLSGVFTGRIKGHKSRRHSRLATRFHFSRFASLPSRLLKWTLHILQARCGAQPRAAMTLVHHCGHKRQWAVQKHILRVCSAERVRRLGTPWQWLIMNTLFTWCGWPPVFAAGSSRASIIAPATPAPPPNKHSSVVAR